MSRNVRIVVLSALAATVFATETEAATTIPPKFRGVWAVDLAGCKSDTDKARLEISARQIDFYETTGKVSKVTIRREREIVLAMRMVSEGETWKSSSRFILSVDGKTLSDISGGADYRRTRCPAGSSLR